MVVYVVPVYVHAFATKTQQDTEIYCAREQSRLSHTVACIRQTVHTPAHPLNPWQNTQLTHRGTPEQPRRAKPEATRQTVYIGRATTQTTTCLV